MSLVFSLGLAFRRQISAGTPPVAVPVNIVAPGITGPARQGQTLTASTGIWTGDPTGYDYQWLRGGTPIGGAVADTYVPEGADVGPTLAVQVIASNPGGASVPATSAGSAVVTAATEASEPIAFGVLDPYNSLTGRTTAAPASRSQGTPIFGSNGALALALNGAVATASVTTASVPWTRVDPDDLIVFAIENPDDPMQGGVSGGILIVSNTYSPKNDTDEPGTGNAGTMGLGGRFLVSFAASSIRAGTWAGQGLDAITAAAVPIWLQSNVNNNYGSGTVKYGPIFRVTERRKPIWAPTFDDNYQRELTEVIPLMEARLGFAAGTSYTAIDLVGQSLRYTLADMAQMRSRGWRFCMDSNPRDEPVYAVHAGGIADAIAALDAHAARIVATGHATTDDVRHICFSYGATSVNTGYATLASCIANGTTTITNNVGTGFFGVNAARGTIIKAPGVPVGTRIVSCPNGNTIIVDRPVPAGTYTLAFCGASFLSSNNALVANGTATVTSVRTRALCRAWRCRAATCRRERPWSASPRKAPARRRTARLSSVPRSRRPARGPASMWRMPNGCRAAFRPR